MSADEPYRQALFDIMHALAKDAGVSVKIAVSPQKTYQAVLEDRDSTRSLACCTEEWRAIADACAFLRDQLAAKYIRNERELRNIVTRVRSALADAEPVLGKRGL